MKVKKEMTAIIIAAQHENWNRITTLIQYGGREACKYVLHTLGMLPFNGGDLYKALQQKKGDFDTLLRKKKINEEQYDNIFPANGITDISKWDITLFTLVITTMFGKQRYKDLVDELRAKRNQEFHKGDVRLTKAEFNKTWKELKQLFCNYGVDKKVVDELKTCGLDQLSQYRYDCVATEQIIMKDQINNNNKFILILYAIVGLFVLYWLYWFSSTSQLTNNTSINNNLKQQLNISNNILKRHYIETIGKQNMKSVHQIYRSKKRFYVELSISSKTDTDQHLANNDRSYHVTQQLNLKKKITIDQLVGTISANNIVLIQGAGGVGKSYTLETAALHWAEGKIWQEMDFVFLLQFRELNLFDENVSLKEAIQIMYQSVFMNLKYDELLTVGDRVMILMDGLDEFANFNNSLSKVKTPYSCNDSSISSGLYSLIQPKCFPGRKLVITGRPSHCEQLRSYFKELSIDSFDILGFSPNQVNEYIENYFSSNKEKIANLKDVIEQSENLQLMSRVPAFLWSLCELHQESESFGNITTMTPIFAWQLTIFLRQHLRQINEDISSNHPMEIFHNAEVKKLVLHLSRVAEMTLTRGEVLIKSSELEPQVNVKQLEKSGLICRVKTSFGDKIQFNHMQMQEFLTAIHYLADRGSNYKTLLSLDSLSGSGSFYAGLSGACLRNSNSSEDLQKFVTILGICKNEEKPFITFPDRAIEALKLSLFLESLYEFQNNLSAPIFGFCDYINFQNVIELQKAYNRNLKVGTIAPISVGSSIVMKSCTNAPKFYILNQILKSCDIRKFDDVMNYFRKCPLKVDDVRLVLKTFSSDFKKIKELIRKWGNEQCEEIIYQSELFEKAKVFLNALQDKCYITSRKCKVWFEISFKYNPVVLMWSNIDVLLLKYFIRSFTKITVVHKAALIHHYFNIASDINESHQYSLRNCFMLKERYVTLYTGLVSQYQDMEFWAPIEQLYNDTLTRKCQASVNHCSSPFYIIQKETRYSTTQLVYFFKHFGHHYNGYINLLKFVKSINSEEAEIISTHICNINMLYLFNSYEYELISLRIITQKIINCSDGNKLNTLLIDYLLMNRTLDYITTNEMSLKKIHNVEHFILRIHFNVNRALKLLRYNILQHHQSPSYKLQHLKMYTRSLTPQCCDYLTEILPFVATITVEPFSDLLYSNYTVNHCKTIILKIVNKLPADSRFKVITLQDWILRNGNEWVIRSDFEINDRKKKSFDDEDYLFVIFFGFLFVVIYYFISFLIFRSFNCLFYTLFAFWLFKFFFWIPGEELIAPVLFARNILRLNL